MTNPITAHRRHFEDLAVGEVIDLGTTRVTREMIIGFATEFDPLPFHLDEAAAKASLLGGLASSGWQTAALTLRMLVDRFLGSIAAMGGLGFSDLKWKKPVMVGDTIGGTVKILELRRSRSHPERGIVTLFVDIANQKGEPVMSMRLANLVELRQPDTDSPAVPTGTPAANAPLTSAMAAVAEDSMPTHPLPYDVSHASDRGIDGETGDFTSEGTKP